MNDDFSIFQWFVLCCRLCSYVESFSYLACIITTTFLFVNPQHRTYLHQTVHGEPEICRVLRDDGVLVAPTFTHADNSFFGKVKAFFMKLAGFPLHSKWTSEEYLEFLRENGWTVQKSAVLKASFPLTYAECVKTEV